LGQEIKNLNLGVDICDVKFSILLYADDIVLISPNENDLQLMLTCMADWCRKWRLKLNVEKSNIVHFRPKRQNRTTFCFKYAATSLNIVSNYKYLGLFFDEFMTFDECAKVLGNSAGRALGGVIAKFKQMKNIGYKTYSKMYDAAVVPVSDYGSGVWGYKEFSAHNNVHNRALRYFLGVHRFAPNVALQADMGWRPPKYRRAINIMLLWNRLIDMNDNVIAKSVFKYDYTACNKNWCSDVKILLESVNLENVYTNCIKCDMDIFSQKLNEIIQSKWSNEICNKPKLRTYIKYKETICVEPYIVNFSNRLSRSLVAQFRFGILPLQLETGRYSNISIEERLCTLCDTNSIEDEIHFLCSCPLYVNERNILYDKVKVCIDNFENMSTDEKFCSIVKSCQKYLSHFICDAWNVRKGVIFRKKLMIRYLYVYYTCLFYIV
jgi:hypothetical protein